MGVSVDIDKLMRTLADKRTAFVSEADFQFALAWTIQQALPACNIRLEYCPFDIDRSMHVDILLSLDGVYYPIELKYTTLAFDVVIDGERVARKSQGAHDILKYDYLKDIARIERLVVADKKFHAGWAILLTNDSSYWLEAKRNDTCDTAFKIHEGAVRGGRMAWAAHTGGTSKGREAPIELRESYPMNWRDYSRISDARWGRFRFLATKVMQNPIRGKLLMQLITDLNQLSEACRGGVAMCIGVFDGVHRGHRVLIDAATREARRLGLKSLVFTFHDHPLSVLAPPYAPMLLSSPEEKAELIAATGVDLCAMIDFTPAFAATPAETFLRDVVAGACQARFIACGDDFRFGQGGGGDAALLRQRGPELGFDVEVVEPLIVGHGPVKSTRIRQALLEGRLDEANVLLGHPYWLTGVIVHGDHRGRTIGYPTANVEPPARRLIPENGIYAARALVCGQVRDAMMSIGIRPTFNSPRRTIEVNILDFSGDIYGQELRIIFIARLRDELKFAGVAELIEAIRNDETACRAILART